MDAAEFNAPFLQLGENKVPEGGCHRVGEHNSNGPKSAYALVKKILVPNARYRQDIGVKLFEHDLERLFTLGLIPDCPPLVGSTP